MQSLNKMTSSSSILQFWFGDVPFTSDTTTASPTIECQITKQYTTLWFPPSNSIAQSNADKTISTRFNQLLQEAEAGQLDNWTENPSSLCALIIILDQFSRHIYRSTVRPPQNDLRAVELSEMMLDRRWHLYLPVPMEIFSLMPLRHSPTIPRLERVLTEIEQRSVREQASQELLDKFRRATTSRLEVLKDAATAASATAASASTSTSSSTLENAENDDHGILERCAFTADEDQLGRHRLVATMQQFIQTQYDGEQNVVAVSLSGGVDSMVIARILVHLRDKFNTKMQSASSSSNTAPSSSSIPASASAPATSSTSSTFSTSNFNFHNLHVVALHLDYGNRAESSLEASFVERWCQKFNITCHSRRIDEIKRGTTPRDEYEKRSRQIRYDFYRQVLSQYGGCSSDGAAAAAAAATTTTTKEVPGIFFGHHRGDIWVCG